MNDTDDDGMTVGLDGDDSAVEEVVEGIGDSDRPASVAIGIAENAESGAS